MKYLLSLALTIMIAATAYGTAQIPEIIFDNGVEKSLLACLLEDDSSTFAELEKRLPEKWYSTALYRKYIGCWKIKNDSLFLESVLVNDKPIKIDDIYSSLRTPSGYFAKWVTGTLRIVSGDIIRYVHSVWESNWENEEFVTVERGVIKKRISYKNRAIKAVDDDGKTLRKMLDSLDFGYIPKRIVLRFGYRDFNKNGIPKRYSVEVVRSCGDTIIDNRVVKTINELPVKQILVPIYYINGEYKTDWNQPVVPKTREPENASN